MTKIPLPGEPMKGSASGRPIIAALHLLSRRWILRIIWELRDGALGFRELQNRCEKMSPDTLSTRLSELKLVRIVETNEQGHWQLTPLGYAMEPALVSLNGWSESWAKHLEKGNS